MNKYFTVKIGFISQDPSQVLVGEYQSNYKGLDKFLNIVIPNILSDYYYSSNFKSDLLSPISDKSDIKQISIDIKFDYDKLNSNFSGNFSTFSDLLKGKLNNILSSSFTLKDRIPPKPDYEIIKDEVLTGDFNNPDNNGLSIIYRIKEILNSPLQNISPTQSTPPVDLSQPISQETSKEEVIGTNNKQQKNADGKFPGVTNVFIPTIKLDPIKMKMPSNEEDRKEFTKGLGYLPFIWYNGYQINYTDIRLFSLFHDGIIPKCKIVFKDTFNIMKSSGFPLDDTKIQVFINAKSKNLKSIHLEFKVQNFQDGGDGSYTIFGTINIPQLYLKKYKSYNQKSSSETIQDVCKELTIGFNSNIDNSDDKMTWINPGKKNFQFLDDVILNSYKSDNSFLIGYIDYYYCFNYVDIEKELGRDNKNDIGIDTSGISANSDKTEEERTTSLALTNDSSFRDSSMYFNKWKIRNDSTSISLKKGYLSKVKFYEDLNKDFLVFDVDSITSEGTKTVILKGAPQDEEFFKDNYSTVWMGKIDIDNSHKNFNYSVVQNRLNLDDLVKISIDIELPNPNFNLYKFQKIFIAFINASPTPSTGLVQERLMGDWLIIDISFVFSNGKMKQMVKAIKRELSTSDNERSGSIPSSKKDQGEINDNPFAVNDININDAGLTSSNPTETTLSPVTEHDLDMIPGSYVDNNGNKIQLCQIDGKPINISIADDYLNMREDAAKVGINLKIQSGFRSPYDTINTNSKSGVKVSASSQQQLYQAYLDGKGNLAAQPGKSNHGNGIGLDLSTGSRKAASNGPLNTKVYDWLVKNSWRYGFIRTVSTEEWHFDYLPSISKIGPYAKLNSSKRDSNRFYSDLGLDKLDNITSTT
jgi:LAS superfamily LD-carboxypeptidase LdcB